MHTNWNLIHHDNSSIQLLEYYFVAMSILCTTFLLLLKLKVMRLYK
jgi:hypothetical protein